MDKKDKSKVFDNGQDEYNQPLIKKNENNS